MAGDGLAKGLIAGLIRRVTVQHEVGHFEKIALASQLIYRIAAVRSSTLFSVSIHEIADWHPGSIGEAGVIAAESGLI